MHMDASHRRTFFSGLTPVNISRENSTGSSQGSLTEAKLNSPSPRASLQHRTSMLLKHMRSTSSGTMSSENRDSVYMNEAESGDSSSDSEAGEKITPWEDSTPSKRGSLDGKKTEYENKSGAELSDNIGYLRIDVDEAPSLPGRSSMDQYPCDQFDEKAIGSKDALQPASCDSEKAEVEDGCDLVTESQGTSVEQDTAGIQVPEQSIGAVIEGVRHHNLIKEPLPETNKPDCPALQGLTFTEGDVLSEHSRSIEASSMLDQTSGSSVMGLPMNLSGALLESKDTLAAFQHSSRIECPVLSAGDMGNPLAVSIKHCTEEALAESSRFFSSSIVKGTESSPDADVPKQSLSGTSIPAGSGDKFHVSKPSETDSTIENFTSGNGLTPAVHPDDRGSPRFEQQPDNAPTTPLIGRDPVDPNSPTFKWFISPSPETRHLNSSEFQESESTLLAENSADLRNHSISRRSSVSIPRLRLPLDDSFIDSSLPGPIVMAATEQPIVPSQTPLERSLIEAAEPGIGDHPTRRSSISMWTTMVEDTSSLGNPHSSALHGDTFYEGSYQDFYDGGYYDYTGYSSDYITSITPTVEEHLLSKNTEELGFENSPSEGSSLSDNSRHLGVWAKFFENAMAAKNGARNILPADYEYDDWPEPLDDSEHDHLMELVISRRFNVGDSKISYIHSKALQLAIVKCDAESTRSLLTLGADPNYTDDLLRTPLHIAAKNSTAEVVSLLADANADLDAKDMLERTPLHVSCIFNNEQVTRYLLESAASTSATDHQGNTPLHLSCRYCALQCTRLLIQYGASLDLKNKKRLNAMGEAKLALQRGESTQEIIDFLRDAYLRMHGKPGQLQSERLSKWGPSTANIGETEDFIKLETPQRRLSLSKTGKEVEFEVSPDGRTRPRLQYVQTSASRNVDDDDDDQEYADEDREGDPNFLAQVNHIVHLTSSYGGIF